MIHVYMYRCSHFGNPVHCIYMYQQDSLALHNNYDCFVRYYVLYRLPNLTFLDSRPIKRKEKDEAQRVGAYMKIVAPSSDDLVSKNVSI